MNVYHISCTLHGVYVSLQHSHRFGIDSEHPCIDCIQSGTLYIMHNTNLPMCTKIMKDFTCGHIRLYLMGMSQYFYIPFYIPMRTKTTKHDQFGAVAARCAFAMGSMTIVKSLLKLATSAIALLKSSY